MLFKVTDIKGDDYWINPSLIRILRQKKNRTEIWITGNNLAISVEAQLDDVAAVVNAARNASPRLDPSAAASEQAAADHAAMMTVLAATG